MRWKQAVVAPLGMDGSEGGAVASLHKYQAKSRLTKIRFMLYFNCQGTKFGSMPCEYAAAVSIILYPRRVFFKGR